MCSLKAGTVRIGCPLRFELARLRVYVVSIHRTARHSYVVTYDYTFFRNDGDILRAVVVQFIGAQIQYLEIPL